jgi:hypothetical protein
MSSGILYSHESGEQRVYFHNPVATLPVISRSGNIINIPWGRRRKQKGNLPLGGWARLEGIYKGQWDKWQPMPVKIPAHAFMEKSHDDANHWFDLIKCQCLQGLVARDHYEQRVYIVTIEPEQEHAWYYRWPRIIHQNYQDKCAENFR